MYKELVEILMCPECKKELKLSIIKEENNEVVDGKLFCDNGHNWVIKEGVVHFGSEEQECANNWKESYKFKDYEELDKEIYLNTPENIKEINNKIKEFIIKKINQSKKIKNILDIATGRGMLLTELVQKINIDAQIICADLSFDVLKYDRLKVKNINPGVRVNYIACDATNLPIKEAAIDMAVSFLGIANMLDKMPEGIKEANRVVKRNNYLLNSGIVIKENSDGYRVVKDWLNSKGIYEAESTFIETGFEKAHEDAGFEYIKPIEIAEGIGEKCENDLLPFENEWFSVFVIECRK